MAKGIDLNQYKPKPDPLKAQLQKHDISIATFANSTGMHYVQAVNFLNGTIPLPRKYKDRVDDLGFTLEIQEQLLDEE